MYNNLILTIEPEKVDRISITFSNGVYNNKYADFTDAGVAWGDGTFDFAVANTDMTWEPSFLQDNTRVESDGTIIIKVPQYVSKIKISGLTDGEFTLSGSLSEYNYELELNNMGSFNYNIFSGQKFATYKFIDTECLLTDLTLTNGYIVEFSDSAFTNLSKLGILNCSRLEIIDITRNYNSLVIDNTKCNDLSIISVGDLTLQNNSTLQYIENITNIDTLTLVDNPSVSLIDLSDSGLNSISFTGTNSLKVLKLNNCNLTSLDTSTLSVLEELRIDNNDFYSSIPFTSTLKYLSANSVAGINPINQINWVGNTNLEYVDIRNNRIRTFIFDGFTNLKHLDLSNNEIYNGNLTDLTSLKLLDLSNNTFSTIDFTNTPTVTNTPNVTHLYLQNNTFELIPDLSIFPSLQVIDLSSNIQGGETEYFPQFSYLNNLREVNLSNRWLTGSIPDLSIHPDLMEYIFSPDFVTASNVVTVGSPVSMNTYDSIYITYSSSLATDSTFDIYKDGIFVTSTSMLYYKFTGLSSNTSFNFYVVENLSGGSTLTSSTITTSTKEIVPPTEEEISVQIENINAIGYDITWDTSNFKENFQVEVIVDGVVVSTINSLSTNTYHRDLPVDTVERTENVKLRLTLHDKIFVRGLQDVVIPPLTLEVNAERDYIYTSSALETKDLFKPIIKVTLEWNQPSFVNFAELYIDGIMVNSGNVLSFTYELDNTERFSNINVEVRSTHSSVDYIENDLVIPPLNEVIFRNVSEVNNEVDNEHNGYLKIGADSVIIGREITFSTNKDVILFSYVGLPEYRWSCIRPAGPNADCYIWLWGDSISPPLSRVYSITAREGIVFSYFSLYTNGYIEHISNITSNSYSFRFCHTLVSIENILVPIQGQQVYASFEDCYNLSSISNIQINPRFINCISLNNVTLDTTNRDDFDNMFEGCTSLTTFNIDTSMGYSFRNMFEGCTSLASIDDNNIDMINAQYITGMFKNCTSLVSAQLNMLNTDIYDFNELFSGCTSLVDVDMCDVVGDKMEKTFFNCSSLAHINLSLNASIYTDTFNGCTSLTCIAEINTENSYNNDRIFTNCPNLVAPNASEQTLLTGTGGYHYINPNPCPNI